jgi:hypothetical protein
MMTSSGKMTEFTSVEKYLIFLRDKFLGLFTIDNSASFGFD